MDRGSDGGTANVRLWGSVAIKTVCLCCSDELAWPWLPFPRQPLAAARSSQLERRLEGWGVRGLGGWGESVKLGGSDREWLAGCCCSFCRVMPSVDNPRSHARSPITK